MEDERTKKMMPTKKKRDKKVIRCVSSHEHWLHGSRHIRCVDETKLSIFLSYTDCNVAVVHTCTHAESHENKSMRRRDYVCVTFALAEDGAV